MRVPVDLPNGQSERFDLEFEFILRCNEGQRFTFHGWLGDVEMLKARASSRWGRSSSNR